MFCAWAEHLETFFFRPPLQDVDVDIAHTPALHLELGRFVEIYRVAADERGPVIVDDVFFARTANSKSRAERKTRPIRRRAHDVATGQIRSERIFVSAFFDTRVCGRADIIHAPEMRICFFDSSDWLVNN